MSIFKFLNLQVYHNISLLDYISGYQVSPIHIPILEDYFTVTEYLVTELTKTVKCALGTRICRF